MTQADLALSAGSSTRHLSCLETGRSQPSREMVLLLAQHLDVPLREQNALLLAAASRHRSRSDRWPSLRRRARRSTRFSRRTSPILPSRSTGIGMSCFRTAPCRSSMRDARPSCFARRSTPSA
ncbi:helix-turn-helix transcriptional regulator [Mesorhizobium sp. B2-7-1]|uniref:helix-turn-helix transcriptional regulator n=1 Tax=Mesorhizobium sp. B2-7-1 TaxID=2589909 RepID=UPI0032B18606